MKTFALALAAVGALALAAPTFAAAQTSTSVGVRADVGTPAVKKKVIVHDRGLHRGFMHSRHLGYAQAHKTTIIKKKPGKTIIKKRIEG